MSSSAMESILFKKINQTLYSQHFYGSVTAYKLYINDFPLYDLKETTKTEHIDYWFNNFIKFKLFKETNGLAFQ